MSKTPFFISAYALVALFTFGHFYVRQPETYEWGGVTLKNSNDRKAFGALIVCVCWPLYWSIELQEKT